MNILVFFYQKVGEAENKHTQSEKQNVILLEVFLVTYRKVNLLVVYTKCGSFGIPLSSIVKLPTPSVFMWHVILCVKL